MTRQQAAELLQRDDVYLTEEGRAELYRIVQDDEA